MPYLPFGTLRALPDPTLRPMCINVHGHHRRQAGLHKPFRPASSPFALLPSLPSLAPSSPTPSILLFLGLTWNEPFLFVLRTVPRLFCLVLEQGTPSLSSGRPQLQHLKLRIARTTTLSPPTITTSWTGPTISTVHRTKAPRSSGIYPLHEPTVVVFSRSRPPCPALPIRLPDNGK